MSIDLKIWKVLNWHHCLDIKKGAIFNDLSYYTTPDGMLNVLQEHIKLLIEKLVLEHTVNQVLVIV